MIFELLHMILLVEEPILLNLGNELVPSLPTSLSILGIRFSFAGSKWNFKDVGTQNFGYQFPVTNIGNYV